MRESEFERKLVKEIERCGGLCLKWVSPGFTGVPDRIAFLPGGRLLLIEVKRPGLADGMRRRQKRVAEILGRLGFTVIRVSSMEELYEYL